MNKKKIRFDAEKEYAKYLDSIDIEYIYQPKLIYLDDKKKGKLKYRADFYLPKYDRYIEIVGSRQAFYSNVDKILKVKEMGFKIDVLKSNGEKFVSKKYKINLDGFKKNREIKKIREVESKKLKRPKKMKGILVRKQKVSNYYREKVNKIVNYHLHISEDLMNVFFVYEYENGEKKVKRIDNFAKYLHD